MPTIEDLRQRRPRPDTAPGIASFAERNRLLGIPSRIPVGGLEAIPAIGSALLGSIPAGLHGLATLGATRGDTDAAARAVQQLQEALTFQPRTQAGQQAVESAGSTLGALGAPAQAVGSQILRETGSPLAATAGEVLLDPLNFLPGGKVPGTIGDLAATVFHGSPHKFNKFEFSPRTLGTGEGAQAFGAGLYFAEDPKIAGHYRAALSRGGTLDGVPLDDAVRTQPNSLFELELEMIEKRGGPVRMDEVRAAWKEREPEVVVTSMVQNHGFDKDMIPDKFRSTYDRLIREGRLVEEKGNLYEVDIPDERVADMLDWDAPLSEQPAAVKNKINPLVEEILATQINPGARNALTDGTATGRDLYFWTGGHMSIGNPSSKSPALQASEALQDMGIPGLKFFDAGSRGGAGEGTRNMVVWDDSILTTLKRNDEPVAQAAE